MRHFLALVLAGSAWAGGLEILDHGARAVARGGAFGAKADDPTAVAHNPGAVSKLRGLELAWNHTLLWSHIAFTRSESEIPDDNPQYEKDPFAKSENETPFFGLGGFLAATYELPEGFGVGLSVFGPSGSGHAEYPIKGGQKYMLTRFDALILYYGATIAWGTDTFGIGATLQWADLAKLEYQLVVDAKAGSDLSPYASGTDVLGTVTVEDRFAPAAILGMWWKPVPVIELGLSGRPFPIIFEAEGDLTVTNVPDQAIFTEDQRRIIGSGAKFELILPPTARVATRYIGGDGETAGAWDIELDFVYEAWSMVEAYELDLQGEIQLFAGDPVQDVTIDRKWRDTLSLRLGGTYFLWDRLGVSLGGYWERGAAADNYAHIDLLSLDRYGVGGGVEVGVGPVEVIVSYMHTWQPDVEVDERFGKVFQQRPVAPCPDGCKGLSGVPANAGTFESSYDMVSIAIGGKL